MAYATAAELRQYIPQLTLSPENDALLNTILDRATAIVEGEVGYSFDTAAVGTATVYGDGTDFLVPPHFVEGTVTGVTTIVGYTVPDYIERDGALVVTRSSLLGRAYRPLLGTYYPLAGGWGVGVPYVVSATFGFAEPPADIKEVTLELAVRIWRGRDAGFSNVVGVEGGGAVGYLSGFPPLAKKILENYRQDRTPGVW